MATAVEDRASPPPRMMAAGPETPAATLAVTATAASVSANWKQTRCAHLTQTEAALCLR